MGRLITAILSNQTNNAKSDNNKEQYNINNSNNSEAISDDLSDRLKQKSEIEQLE
jgi:hypothetical protein